MPRRVAFGLALLGFVLFAAAIPPLLARAGAPAPPAAASEAARSALAAVLEDFWKLRLRNDLATRLALGMPIAQLPDVSEQDARATAAEARRLLERLERIDGAALSHDDWLSLEIAKWEARQTAALQDHFWLAPQLAMSRLPLRTVHTVLAALPLRSRADLDNYLGLVRQYPGLVRELRKNFETARSRGILPPRDLIDVIEPVLRAFVRKPEEGPLPGQALGYKMGSRKFQELRTRAEKALGDEFDIRRFHDAVLSPGSMPLTVLDKHIDWWIAEKKRRRP
jgi:uncharacterized protein (DUF885 family)